ncbi:MAG: MFS transporter, partial [Acidobacteriia bacterium]|nr:MFS transporter [Terriglobia bacterium]
METAAKAIDVGALLDLSEWSSRQKAILALTALAITFDGFDNQLAGFALPSIIKAWGVTRAAFGPVLALGLVGMSFGAIFGGHFGDRLGRRVALTASIVLFGIATGLT